MKRQEKKSRKVTDELENKNIGSLLINYSLPAIIAMTAASIYNIIDRILIGQIVGAMAIAGLAITFPLMNLAAAFGSLVGSGSSTMISIRLGEKKSASAMRFLGNGLVINVVLGILFSILGLIFLDPLLYAFGASNQTISYARDFMRVILFGNVITQVYIGLNNMLRSSGYPTKAMRITLITVACNIVLASLFIYVFHWGIKGAAWATVISQCIGLIFVILHYTNESNSVYFRKRYLNIKPVIAGKIFSMGMSSFLMNLCACLVVIVLNIGLKKYGGDLAIGAYGIVNSVIGLVVMIAFGLNLGMQPIAGYNYGAKNYNRVLLTLKYALIGGCAITTVGFLFCELTPYFLARAFTSDQDMIALTVRGMRITAAVFPIVGIQIIAASFFQAVGRPKTAILISLTRQVLFLLPLLLLLPRIWALDGVWVALPISDGMSAILAVFVLVSFYRKTKQL